MEGEPSTDHQRKEGGKRKRSREANVIERNDGIQDLHQQIRSGSGSATRRFDEFQS